MIHESLSLRYEPASEPLRTFESFDYSKGQNRINPRDTCSTTPGIIIRGVGFEVGGTRFGGWVVGFVV
jgi:hypothetical protein